MILERLRWVSTRFTQLFRRGKKESELDAELRFHLENLIAENRAQGMSERDARLAAQREFGNSDTYREEIRDIWRPFVVADLWRSIRFAFRSLARTPGFTAIAILTVALGVGANTSMFSISNEVMLKPLPYPNTNTLDQVFRTTPQNAKGAVSAPDFRELTAATADFAEVTGYAYGDISLAAPGQPAEATESIRVLPNLFSVLGVLPSRGRTFLPEEGVRGNHRVAIISERLWLNRFGGDRAIIGKPIRVDGETHEVVGVLPAAFNDWRHLGWVDVFRPLALTEAESADREKAFLIPILRRKPESSSVDAAAIVASVGEHLAAMYPAINSSASLRLVSIDQIRLGETGGVALSMLIGLSGFVLLIACSNLANFCLARAIARAREFAVRGALGASRSQLLRPVLLESLVLALTGGALAIVVARVFSDWVRLRSMGENGESVNLSLDWKVMGWAFGASLLTALLFGLAPSIFALRLDLFGTLKSGGRGTIGSPGHRKLGQILIIGQFALALVLLTGAALFVRGLNDLNNRRQGWQSDQVLTASIKLPETGYPTNEAMVTFQDRVLERLSALPGVQSATVCTHLPFLPSGDIRKFEVEGEAQVEPGREPAAYMNRVGTDYFTTVGTQLLSGREFNTTDAAGQAAVYIINEAMARGVFGAENPIGRRLSPIGNSDTGEGIIVGVVRDVKSIFPDPVGTAYQFYRPFSQEPGAAFDIALRTSGVEPSALMESLRSVVQGIDPDLPLKNLKPANERISRANYQLAVLRDMLTAIAILGLALAAMGLYGVIARSMALRSSEFGVRLALGAQVSDIMRLVLVTGVKLALAGSLFGLLGAYGIAALLSSGFPGMKLDNAASILGSSVTLIVIALLACYLPARAAAKISPSQALRAE